MPVDSVPSALSILNLILNVVVLGTVVVVVVRVGKSVLRWLSK
jgi:hypothetical protein